jgi:cytochrome c2|uniref:Hypothetical cytochrome C family protein n=1 Tax=uncultured Pseudomonadota bacterium TaxID=153809 RepID=A0A2P0QJG1_9PROT|nr:hypothetical cytochrome C family protein [uncultured proteobacterium]|tara:strand:- start:139 stop:255 length:117 start_codon:yes stop_codon:yes gene_type:complete
MKTADLIWTEETLKEHLTNLKKCLPGNKMVFADIKDEK